MQLLRWRYSSKMTHYSLKESFVSLVELIETQHGGAIGFKY